MKTSLLVSFSLISILALAACLPTSLQQAAEPTADVQGTAVMLAETIAAQTLESLPTPTMVPPTETPTLLPIVETETPTLDPLAILTSLPTETTPTTSPATPTTASQEWTCDKIPEFADRGTLVIENSTSKSIYVSLFGISKPHEYHVCYGLELKNSTAIELPLGNYTYVVIAGGAKFSGTFSYTTDHKMVMTVHKDRVAIH